MPHLNARENLPEESLLGLPGALNHFRVKDWLIQSNNSELLSLEPLCSWTVSPWISPPQHLAWPPSHICSFILRMTEVRYAAGPLAHHRRYLHRCKLPWGPRSACSSGVVGPNLRLSSTSRILALGGYPRGRLKQIWFNSQTSARISNSILSLQWTCPQKLYPPSNQHLFSKNQAHVQIVPSGRKSCNQPTKCPHAWMERHIQSERQWVSGEQTLPEKDTVIPICMLLSKNSAPLLWKIRGENLICIYLREETEPSLSPNFLK